LEKSDKPQNINLTGEARMWFHFTCDKLLES